MRFPPVKPYEKALQELTKDYDYEKCKASFSQVMDLAAGDELASLEVCYCYYDIYVDMGKREDIKQVMARVRELPAPEDKLPRALCLLLEYRYSNHQGKKDLSLLDQAFALLEEHSGNVYFLAVRLRARHCYETRNFEQAIKWYTHIIEDADKNLLDTLTTAHSNLAIIYAFIGEYDAAEAHFLSQLRLHQELGFKKEIAGAYSNLGELAHDRIRHEANEESIQEYLSEAIRYAHLALDTIGLTSDLYFKINILGNLGIFYAEANDFIKAIHYAQESLSVAQSLNMARTIGVGCMTLGKIYAMAGEYHKSLTYLEESIRSSESLHGREKVDLYEQLGRVCGHLHLFEKGYVYAHQHATLLQEFNEKQKAAVVYHNKVLQEKVHRHENELHNLQLRSVEEKMQSQAAQLVSQTELLAKFRDELREIARQYPSSDPGWRAVKEKLKELPCKQIDWEKFETEFAAVHPEFTHKLTERYPTLTPMEVKMCSLLRLNLKSHEIARLFCVTERAVEFHRLNIRKKCSIPKEQNLSVFLNSL